MPNTYQFNWATTADEAVQRMAKEYKKFWTAERKAKAKKLNLSQSEVAVLASIVQAEQTVHSDERPKVAGLYINRLRIGMALQSDPTLVYGLGDFINDYSVREEYKSDHTLMCEIVFSKKNKNKNNLSYELTTIRRDFTEEGGSIPVIIP